MSLTPAPPIPTEDEWRRLGIVRPFELQAGKQSRVFRATLDGEPVVVKLTDRRLSDGSILEARMETAVALAAVSAAVVAPTSICGELVRSVGGWWMTATPFVDGSRLDVAITSDGELMGRTLADLHAAMAKLPRRPIPSIAPIDDRDERWKQVDRSRWQLLHGDFSDRNVIAADRGPRILDFDDCGYGPAEFDVANSLYMVLFDSVVGERPDRYRVFRPSFLDGYDHGGGGRVTHAVIDELIEVRIAALDRWLDDLPNAPIGIRTSSPAWRDTLRAFVQSREPAAD